MKVLKANEEQLKTLDGYRSGSSMLCFFADYAGNMTTSVNVVDNPDFEAIRNDLLQLEEIDYIEFPSEEDI